MLRKNSQVTHPSSKGKPGQDSTVRDHTPENHKKFIQWNVSRFISWAESVGAYTASCVQAILSSYKVEQQGYRSCMALLKLEDKNSVVRLEIAFAKAFSYTPRPSSQNIKTILTTSQDRLETINEVKPQPLSSENHEFVRGADYHGRG
ncbi:MULTISPECIES: hypothetical protein [Paenibacillus]|uniref:Uncharacterized protein n=1 Tax=Paenibacillus odorifer TaxID=189426 RepID=A0A1R0X307_9BACL|nr:MULTISPECIES: hypothetical protein [Paenibacillus]ETT61184.1 integrase catalytic subunit [Paenibacillus sp. FSL H8-237]MEC0134733.1 hypothetical protein [Paenibacillus odorifer]MEC0221910.1 hypothetical protein [Paenibacillus odorifer]OMD26469.1 hypothetical protein BJP48_22825 [Paenibacillus odorifer]OMD27675.1 hypothetical protein BJP51_24475 [Paenibacillus odorifer]